MDSLISYESEDENDFTEDVMVGSTFKHEVELDANYDVVGMDESDEDVNSEPVEQFVSYDYIRPSKMQGNSPVSLADAPLDFRPNRYRDEINQAALDRRHSIDMEMDDDTNSEEKGEDEYTDDELSDCENSPGNEATEENNDRTDEKLYQRNEVLRSKAQDDYDDGSTKIEESYSKRRDVERHEREDETKNRRYKSWRKDSSPPFRRETGLKRSHSPEWNSKDKSSYHRGSSKSPERSWKNRRLERRPPGIGRSDYVPEKTAREIMGESLKTQIQQVEARTGITLPTYYNPAVMNPIKYAQQIQKRKLLWGNKASETKARDATAPATPWDSTTFKGDNDGRMTEKFKRLMGIKTETSGTSAPVEGDSKFMIAKQEEMFSNMEAQYQVARMVTHTHRGVGLGYGTYQTRPPLQRNS